MPVSPVLPTVQPAAQLLAMYHPILTGARLRIVTRHVINALTATELESCQDLFTPDNLSVAHQGTPSIYPEHVVCPMVHPITGETISSYKKQMNDPATAETWQTAFGEDFGVMLQSNNKTGQKGTNAMFVMTHDEIRYILAVGKKFTFSNPFIDYRSQKKGSASYPYYGRR
jgi:hypothetical protein